MSTTAIPTGAPTPPPPPVSPPSGGGRPPAQPSPGPPRATRSASRVIAILTIALGAAIIVGAILSAVLSTVAAAAVRTETRTIDASGLSGLDVDVDAASLRIEFADVSQATLEVTSGGGAGAWTLERDDDELSIATPERAWLGWFSRAFADETRATLTLPSELSGAGLDASLGLRAGDLLVEGDFGALDIEVGAGSLTATGSARTLTAELSAGDADIELKGVSEAEFQVSAGTVDSRLTGAPPKSVIVDVSAGSLDLTLPDAAYDVRSEVSAGEFENGLRTEVGARNHLEVSVSAGSVTVDSAR